MNRNLLKVYEQYKDSDQVYFLSHSIDFKYDQPHVLKEYAHKLGLAMITGILLPVQKRTFMESQISI